MSDTMEIGTKGPEESFALGRRLSCCLEAGDIVGLCGELGAGKTVVAQGICRGLEVRENVTSPTFTLVQEYHGRLPVFHVDFYRLSSLAEIEQLDLGQYFYSGGVILIEWAEKAEALLPENRYSVMIEYGGTEDRLSRRIRINGRPGKDLRDCML